MTRLVFIHGRQQQNLDAQEQKDRWIKALRDGLGAQKLNLPLRDTDIRFAYYGDTLDALERQSPPPDVIVQGDEDAISNEEVAFMADVLESISRSFDDFGADGTVIEKGLANHPKVLQLLRWLNTKHPEVGGPILFLRTHDVYRYVTNQRVFSTINSGVEPALSRHEPNIIVSHSLGTVVAYSILSSLSRTDGWDVPLFVTLGCPLGVSKIKQELAKVAFPSVVDTWLNAYDPLDVVALHPLDRETFPTSKPIENYGEVENTAPDHHGIEDYLSDPVVSARIRAAMP